MHDHNYFGNSQDQAVSCTIKIISLNIHIIIKAAGCKSKGSLGQLHDCQF